MTKKEQNTHHHHHHQAHGHEHKPFFGGKILTGILIVAFLLLFTFVFVVPAVSSNITNEKIELAILIPLTGKEAEYGGICKEGIDLALKDAQDRGKNIELVYYDTKSDPMSALDAFFHAVEDGYQIILGPFRTEEAEYIAPYAEIYNTVIVTPASGPSLSEYPNYVFRFVPSNTNFCYAIVSLAKTYGLSNITVVWTQDTLGKSTYDAFVEVADKEGINITGIPFSSNEEVIDELNKSQDDFVYFIPETPEQLSELMSTMAACNLSLLSKTYCTADNAFGNAVRDNIDAFGTSVLLPSQSTADPIFLQKFKDQYGFDFNVTHGYALYGYDALTTLIDVMGGSKKSGHEISNILKEYRYLGQTGPIIFDENLDRFPTYDTYTSEWGTWGKLSIFEIAATQKAKDVSDYIGIRMRILEAYHSGDEDLARQIYEEEWK